jgi:hypothetical protein
MDRGAASSASAGESTRPSARCTYQTSASRPL